MMKNLANCNPREFLVQTNKIRKSVKNWIDLTGIVKIRKRMPVLLVVPEISENATEEEKAKRDEVLKKNREALQEQSQKNLMDILEAALETNLEETLEILCYVSFIDPADVEKYRMAELLAGFNEIINCQEVLDFFTSLMSLGLKNISGTAKA